MPKKSQLHCYFGCQNDGPLHLFPNPNTGSWEVLEKFNIWKSVLPASIQEKGNNYIYNSIRLCNNHFLEVYCLPSRRLTRNAVPTLRLEPQVQSLEEPVVQSTHHNRESDRLSSALTEPSTSAAVNTSGYAPELQVQSLEELVQSTQHNAESGQPSASGALIELDFLRTTNLRYNQASTSAASTSGYAHGVRKHKRPKANPENKLINKLKNKLEKISKKYNSQKSKIRAAKKLSLSKSFLSVIDKLPQDIQTFTKLQLKSLKKPKGRRFTVDEKIMSLTILKQSPKAYQLMKKLFVLPSKRCLQNMLSNFSVKPGINEAIMNELRSVAQSLPAEKKLVALLFDEISLAPGVEYNAATGQIIGFEDMGNKRNKTLADHALVLMIKGIKSKSKQALCFTFCKSSTKAFDLKNILVEAIKQLETIGFRVVATICDQAASNIKVIKMLQEATKQIYLQQGGTYESNAFEIDGNKVFPLFDTPHLLKGVRNNLLIKDAQFVQNGETKWAKWDHLKLLLDLDEGDDEIRLVNKLTEMHVIKDKIPKMKVKYAAQVFSQRVSSAMRFLARHKVLPEECKGTADFLLIFDKLFDTFNGHSYKSTDKPYKECLKNNSAHFQLWDDMIPILESIKFKSVVRKNGRESIKYESIPSVKNWIQNMITFKEMWHYLITQHDVKNLITRSFNQDPLENFFSGIRSNGIRNVNPTCNQFCNAFKTLIINNFNSLHSPRANCENDDNNAFKSMANLLNYKKPTDSDSDDFVCDIDCLLKVMGEIKCNDKLVYAESKKYVIGYVIKKCKSKIFRNCKYCMRDLCRSEVDMQSFNYEIDYTKHSLFHPSKRFVDLMTDIFYVIVACLRDSPESTFINKKIKLLLNCACDYQIISCKQHKDGLIDLINNLAINLIIHSWCKGVNRILNGKLSKFDKNDLVKQQALQYYLKRRKK